MRTSINFTGISNNPSVYSSADGVMSHLVNFIPENEELKVVGKSKILWYVPPYYKLLYIHNTKSEGKHYIFLYESTDGNKLYYQVAPTGEDASDFIEIGDVVGTPKIVSIGNTLIAYSQNEMRYFLWKEETHDNVTTWFYKNLGTHLPELDIKFGLLEYDNISSQYSYTERNSGIDRIDFNGQKGVTHWASGFCDEDTQSIIGTQILGIANLIINLTHKYGGFIFPFFVRYAYRLYDGSTLTMHSAPILMLPSSFEPMYIELVDFALGDTSSKYRVQYNPCKLFMEAITTYNELKDFNDIISSIDIFISSPIYTYKASGYDKIQNKENSFYEICIKDTDEDTRNRNSYGIVNGSIKKIAHQEKFFFHLPLYTYDEIEKDVETRSLFYLLKSIDLNKLDDYSTNLTYAKTIDIETSYLQSLVNKEVMTDDYNSHNHLLPGSGFVYNNRLSLANVVQKLFNGWSIDLISPRRWNEQRLSNTDQYSIYYRVEDDKGTVTLAPKKGLTFLDTHALYFYYPSTMAKAAILRKVFNDSGTQKTLYKTYELNNHDFLNGSFACIPFWQWECYYDQQAKYWSDGAEENEPTIGEGTKIETSKVYTSEANMPFYFPVTGINTVGNGEIYALTTTTQALSEGQFGQYPLYALTSKGVWALTIGSTGGISSVVPVTRDICINPENIMQLDDSVAFITDRGLMLLIGSRTQCLSETLNGDWFDPSVLKGFGEILSMAGVESLSFKSFGEFAKDAFLAYDFPRQRILVCNPSSKIALTYSLKSFQWGQATIGEVTAVANTYPNCVLQIGTNIKVIDPSGKTYYKTTITDTSQENKTDTVKTLAVTRPFSFGDKDMLKTVNDVIVRGDNVGIALYGSRDLKTWHYIGSCKNRFIRGLQGSPYKSFRLVMVGEMTPSDLIVGASFEITPKDDNILR